MLNPIKFSEQAIRAIRKFESTLQIPPGHFLRVGIRQKNETTRRLLIGFDEKKMQDKEMEVQGIKIIYSPGEIFFFAGMLIDFVERDGRQGFVFTADNQNPG